MKIRSLVHLLMLCFIYTLNGMEMTMPKQEMLEKKVIAQIINGAKENKLKPTLAQLKTNNQYKDLLESADIKIVIDIAQTIMDSDTEDQLLKSIIELGKKGPQYKQFVKSPEISELLDTRKTMFNNVKTIVQPKLEKSNLGSFHLDTGKNGINSSNIMGGPALIEFAHYVRYKFAKLLLENGAKVDIRDRYGRTPLIEAMKTTTLGRGSHFDPEVVQQHIKMAELLLSYGADIEAEDNNDVTPLIEAAIHSFPEAVKLLLKRGADPKKTTVEDKTALDYALGRLKDYEGYVQDPNNSWIEGDTIIYNRCKEVVHLLKGKKSVE